VAESGAQTEAGVCEFRSVRLPDPVGGALLLHSMPGRQEPLEQVFGMIHECRVDAMVSLAHQEEIRVNSPSYWEAILEGRLPCERIEFPIVEFGIPEDAEAFWKLACDLAVRLREGRHLLIHCLAGIGRTGMLATCVLLALGQPLQQAKATVNAAGSGSETSKQADLVTWYARRVRWDEGSVQQ
jgi:predicted protein tyrosine phosphatase